MGAIIGGATVYAADSMIDEFVNDDGAVHSSVTIKSICHKTQRRKSEQEPTLEIYARKTEIPSVSY